MFELYQLRYFLAVVETGSFTKAAGRTFVTQPTLSAGIKKLEAELGVPLFQRSSRRVFLTEAGTRFVPRAKSILLTCNQAAQAVQDAGNRDIIRLGVLRTIPSEMVARLLADFRASRPTVVIELFEGSEQELQNRLDEGTIDLAITILRGRLSESALLLFEEDYRLALSSSHPLAGREEIEAEELAQDTMIVRTRCEALSATSNYFTDRNVRPRLVYRTGHDERAVQMVAAGLGVTVLPACYRAAGVRQAKLIGFDAHRKLGLVRGLAEVVQDREELIAQFEAFSVSQDWLMPLIMRPNVA